MVAKTGLTVAKQTQEFCHVIEIETAWRMGVVDELTYRGSFWHISSCQLQTKTTVSNF